MKKPLVGGRLRFKATGHKATYKGTNVMGAHLVKFDHQGTVSSYTTLAGFEVIKERRYEKHCDRCGKLSKVKPRERRCKLVNETGFTCWGALTLVKKEPVKKRYQDLAEAKRKQARYRSDRVRREMETIIKRIARLVTLQKQYERQQDYYAAQAALTDEQLAAQKAKREEKQKPKRQIKIGGL